MRVIASLCACSLLVGCIGHHPEPQRPMHLQRVILYQNGIGYFERGGHVQGETLKLEFGAHELDDVLKTLTVIDRLGAGVATVDVPTLKGDDKTIGLGVRMSAGRVHDVKVSYAVPTPTWKAAYRVVMDDGASKKESLLQGWAMVNNASQEDWGDVQLTLATGAPMSFVHDLHTPQYVSRPDINGNLIAPTVIGPVSDEHARTGDTDRDGIVDIDDVCPDSAEERDSFEDEDGCPDVDNDRDRILDRDDKCPNEPESYNGFEDEDGCPDRGRVVITDTSLEVLDLVYFGKGSATIEQRSFAILDAIAATLKGNPTIRKVEVGGHASDDEADGWSLASRRAAAVRQYLIDRGVESRRLAIVPYGGTRPLDAKQTDAARAKNRRADFLITQREEFASERPSRRMPTKLDTKTMQASVHTASKPAEVAGTVRYVLSEPVTIKKGSSSMVSILNKPIGAEDVYLFRPDGNAPGSDRHPFRAVRLINDSGFMLEPGPIAIFARGTFVGDSMVTRLNVGETAWIPYAVDGSTTVTATTDASERPVKIVSISRGVLTVENAAIHVTTYSIDAGQEPAKRIFLRHAKLPGYTTKDLPPGTQDRGDSFLIPLPLQAGKSSSLTIEERQPRTQTMHILDAGATQIGLYVDGSHLPDGIAEKLKAAIELRKEMGKIEESLEALRDRLADLTPRADDIRENLKAIEKVRGSDDLRRRLVASLTQVTTESDAIAKKLGLESESLANARTKLQDALRDISLDGDR
ncbi:MAG TPA: OmpA family protein [Kofleriaceae bacterium]|nr:OmpA family protein [Kofleriaceae bacterium]